MITTGRGFATVRQRSIQVGAVLWGATFFDTQLPDLVARTNRRGLHLKTRRFEAVLWGFFVSEEGKTDYIAVRIGSIGCKLAPFSSCTSKDGRKLRRCTAGRSRYYYRFETYRRHPIVSYVKKAKFAKKARKLRQSGVARCESRACRAPWRRAPRRTGCRASVCGLS